MFLHFFLAYVLFFVVRIHHRLLSLIQSINQTVMRQSIFKFSLSALFIVISFLNLNGQGRISLSTGVAFTEGLNLGIRYQIKQSEIGVTAGVFAFYHDTVNPTYGHYFFSTSYYYHFYGKSKLSDLKTWYFKTGLSYTQNTNEIDATYKNVALNFNLGHQINLSKRVGINLSAGAYYLPWSTVTIDESTQAYTWDKDFGFSGEISLFIRLGKAR
jgi:hypothetical protein